jgi:hypothetical protein
MAKQGPTKAGRGAPRSAILGTRDGESIVLLDKSEDPERGTRSGGVIYTDEMPSLEEVLKRYDVVTAVLERPLELEQKQVAKAESRRLSFGRAVVLGGFPMATLAVGIVMMVGAFVGESAATNPYLGLYLVIAGIGLSLTSWTALRRG